MQLRPYQGTLAEKVQAAWAAGFRNVLMRLDTGGGKTVILCWLITAWPGGVAVIAHRQELVMQLSLTLARHGVVHNIIASDKVRRAIIAAHLKVCGQSFYNAGSRIACASVDTLVRAKGLEWWFPQVTLWVTDEGHHVVENNKWHRAIELFTNQHVHGLLPTATPGRADGKGLGRHADGVADCMVEGPPMLWLMEQGFLTFYDIVIPPSDLEVLEEVGSTGDWSPAQLKEASKRSHITGDVVELYTKWSPGKIGAVFTTDVETATEMTAAFRAAGWRAETITGETDGGYRLQCMAQLAARQLDVIVVVDVVSEGTDVPALEVIIMARPSQSYPLYAQQFGRPLRPLDTPAYKAATTQAERLAAIAASPKPRALIIDPAGNFIRHQGGPDRARPWSLDRRNKRASGTGTAIPMRACLGCFKPYEKFYLACPYCGAEPEPPATRSSPEVVEGDLVMLDEATLARLREPLEVLDLSMAEYQERMLRNGTPAVAFAANARRHQDKQMAQVALRDAMALFGGRHHAAGRTDREIQKLFFFTFGIDVLSAQALGIADAEALTERIRNHG